MKKQIIPVILAALLMVLFLPGCASVNEKHAFIENTAEAPAANVYFIRPRPYKNKGFANKPIRIVYQKQDLLELDEGSYTLLRIKPSDGELRVYSWTRFTNMDKPQEVWRQRVFKFFPDTTYFIYLKQVNEEFRGIFYVPELVGLEEAKQLIEEARASGAARKAPIDELKEVKAPPSSAEKSLPPALPENIYQSEKYLHKVR